MLERIKGLSHKYYGRMTEYRQKIHKNPELSLKEYKTAEFVAEVLKSIGVDTLTGIGNTGVVGIINGKGKGKVIALRADMDALPIEEKTGLPFASINKGVMHACGHDVHTAMLLGCAHVLSELRDEIYGTVKLIFQPAEENNPAGGAPAMIKDGVLQNPEIDAIMALHVWPQLETGTAAIKKGPMMGSSDRFFVTINGKSSHGAAPNEGIDAIVLSANIINALQTIVSRNINPLDPSVISIGKINGGYRYNVIADRVDLEGTIRSVDVEIRNSMPVRIENVIAGITKGMGGAYEFKYVKGYPPTINHPELTEIISGSMKKVLGNNFLIPEKPALGGEDFSFFSEKIPAAFIWLGCRNKKIPVHEFSPLHNPYFNPDEECMRFGTEILVNAAIEYLNS